MQNQITLIIPGEFILFNEYDGLSKRNKYAAGTKKNEEDWRVVVACHAALGADAAIMEEAYPMHVHYAWYRKTARADSDGIRFAAKFINDGLQKAGLLRNDSLKEINATSDSYHVDKLNPRVEVTLTAREGF